VAHLDFKNQIGLGENAFPLETAFIQLAVLKQMLKGLYVAIKREHAPPIYNLPRLARLTDIQSFS
jgi:hypothetical protein